MFGDVFAVYSDKGIYSYVHKTESNKTLYYGVTKPEYADIGDEWLYVKDDYTVEQFKKTENGWENKMKKHEKVCNLNLSMKMEDSFITMLFDGDIGTMFKQDVGKIEIKDNMDGESVLNELKSIADGTMGI